MPKGFEEPGVGSVYMPLLTQKVSRELYTFRGGDAIFTFPNTPIKCAGAPQKTCYLADEIFRMVRYYILIFFKKIIIFYLATIIPGFPCCLNTLIKCILCFYKIVCQNYFE